MAPQRKAKPVRDDNKKFGKLLDLIQELSVRPSGMTYGDIIDLMGYQDVRQANRDIGFIKTRFSDAFLEERDPVNPRVKRFRLLAPKGLPLESLTQEEMVALSNAIRTVRNDDISGPLKKLEYKINCFFAANDTRSSRALDLDDMVLSRAAAHIPHPHIDTDPVLVRKIDMSVLGYTKIIIKYAYDNGGAGNYKVRPLGFLYGKSNNYLIAYRDDEPTLVRSYILGRIRDVKATTETFDAGNFDIAAYAQRSFGVYHSPDGPFDIEWRASPDVADAAARYVFHPTQTLHKNADGSLTIRFQADGFMEMGLYLFQWRGKIVPIAPAALVDQYRQMLNDALCSIGQDC